MPDATPLTLPARAGTQDLLNAMRSLFTCTRKVRSWVSNVGPLTVLDAVAEQGEAKVSAIASALLMDVSTVSRSLSGLCRDGLVQWRTDSTDGRSHLVSCTPAGLHRLAERRDQVAAELERRLAGWPQADVAQLSDLLNRFVASLIEEQAASSASSSTHPTSPSTAKESA
jgi:DNA-binding MarR family transcriptional regulator